jgi:hypothetical protein
MDCLYGLCGGVLCSGCLWDFVGGVFVRIFVIDFLAARFLCSFLSWVMRFSNSSMSVVDDEEFCDDDEDDDVGGFVPFVCNGVACCLWTGSCCF